MLGMPEATQYDLKFRLLGIPVRVHPFFWIMAALLGREQDLGAVAIWIGCVFVSILVHEFGHATMARMFGAGPFIVLYGMGGLCYTGDDQRKPWQRLAVIFSGPGAGLLFCGLIFGGYLALGSPRLNHVGGEIVNNLIVINLFWSLLNLLPVWPLDGGQMMGVVLSKFNRINGMRWAHVVSLLVAGGFAVWRLEQRDFFTGVLFAFIAFSNYQVLESLHAAARSKPARDEDDWWKR
jgi:stage IV sporulation protein FB